MRRTFGWIALTAVAAIGCDHGSSSNYQPKAAPKLEMASVQEGANQNLLPLEEGNQWTYEAVINRVTRAGMQPGTPTSQTWKVTKVERGASGTQASLDVIINDKVEDHQVWLANSKGLFQISVGGNAYSTPQPAVLFPLQSNKEFKWSGTGLCPNGQTGSSETASKVEGQLEVDTDKGRMATLGISSLMTFKTPGASGKMSAMVWFAPGIGIARSTQDAVINGQGARFVLKLKGHSLKKS